MDFAKLSFLDFMQRMGELFACPCYTRSDVSHVASYFWDRMLPEIKSLHRAEARVLNDAQQLQGKDKIRGFWVFAQELEKAFLQTDYDFYESVWFHMQPGCKNYWLRKMQLCIECEIKRVIS